MQQMVEKGTFENAPKYIHCEEKGEDNLLSDLLREPPSIVTSRSMSVRTFHSTTQLAMNIG
jgi:hypothetical protein